jgi:DNA-binding IclR family transcriptional regulator
MIQMESSDHLTGIIKSAGIVLRVLKAFGNLPYESTLAEIVRELDLPKMKAFRAVNTLVDAGFLDRNSNSKKYRLHSNVLSLADKLLSSQNVRTLSHDRLQQLALDIGEDITVAVPAENLKEIIFVDRLYGGSRFTFYCDVGKKLPLHIGAAARAVLSYLPQEQFEIYLSSFSPVKMSSFTIISRQELRKERDRIRKIGYSISNQEVDEGVSAVGTCILDSDGFPAAGVSVTSLSVKMTQSKIAKLGTKLSSAAREISSYFGFKESEDAHNSKR